MKETPLIILGAGNSTVEILDLIDDINFRDKRNLKVVGILDDNIKISKNKINDVAIIGTLNDISKFKKENFFLSILSYKNRFKRKKLLNKLTKYKNKFISLIHPNSIIGK